VIKFTLKKCLICAKHKGELITQIMGDLPETRVNPCRPCSKTGVDNAGPYLLRAIPSRNQPSPSRTQLISPTWPLARTTEIHPGADGLTCVVTLRTAANGTMKRPIHKLCLLHIEKSTAGEETQDTSI
jgi:hypothetical protein